MKVYLLRHGQTEYNVDKRYQGTRDIPLSEKGRAAGAVLQGGEHHGQHGGV